MTDVTHATFRVYACPGGGFVLAELIPQEEGGMEQDMKRAVSNLDECVGAIGQAVRDWHAETQRVARAHAEDENPKIIKPRRFWPSLLQRACGDE